MTPRFVELHDDDLARDEGRSAEGLCAKPEEPVSSVTAPPLTMRTSRLQLALAHALLLGGVFAFWYAMTEPGLIPPF